jgi:phospholipase C
MALNDIEHIVVVMMENRSFDNLLGWLNDNQANPPKFNIVSHLPTGWPPANNPNVVPTSDAP